MINLYKGSIFDSKCDLIVIPCNNLGGVRSINLKYILAEDLPFPNKILAGDISFVENIRNFSNATAIGYAATVDIENRASSEYIVRNILNKIKNYCREKSFLKVNIPLLGTGAGHLSHKFIFDLMRLEFCDDPDLSLCIYVLSEKVYNKLTNQKEEIINNSIKNPRVFISYTGIDLNNRKWVEDFAYRLRENGVDARIDMFHLKPGQDLPQWMTNEIIMADKVILICDKYYAEKADYRKGGVGWETMIIQGDMLSNQNLNKYIAIIKGKDVDESLPVYVKSKYALNWSNEDYKEKDFNELLLYLFDCDIAPPVGDVPQFVKEKIRSVR